MAAQNFICSGIKIPYSVDILLIARILQRNSQKPLGGGGGGEFGSPRKGSHEWLREKLEQTTRTMPLVPQNNTNCYTRT